MLIPSGIRGALQRDSSLSRRVNANSQLVSEHADIESKLIKKGEC